MKRKIIIFAAALCLLCGGAKAEIRDLKTDFSYQNGWIDISGYIPNPSIGENVSILVKQISKENLIDVRVTGVGADGAFSEKIGINYFPSGRFILQIKSNSENDEREVHVITKKDVEEIKQLLDAQKTDDILNNPKLLAVFGICDQELISINNKQLTKAALIESRSLLDTNPPEQAKKVFSAAVTDFINEKKGTDQIDYLEKAKILPLSKTYTRYRDREDFRKQISLLLDGKQYISNAEFQKYFAEFAILSAIRNPIGREDILTVTEENSLSVNWSVYNNLSKEAKESVLKNIAYREYASSEEYIRAFDLAAANAQAPSQVSGGGGNGGGNGSNTKSSSISAGVDVGGVISGEEQAKNDLSDVPDTYWAAEQIRKMKQSGIISGYKDNTFKPSQAVTREEFVTMMVKAFKLTGTGNISFDDVSEKDWFYAFVNCAAANGIVSGVQTNLFGTGNCITREEAATMLYRIKGTYKLAEITFADKNEISGFAVDAVGALSAAGVISGRGENRFEPKMTLTRAEAAVLLYNLMD